MIGPKPRYPKPERLTERYAVTIIAGFKGYDGVVLCSDTQETIAHSKRTVSKLRFEPNGGLGLDVATSPSQLAAAFCGAGHGPFIDKLIEEAWDAAQGATSLDEACDFIEESIKEQYREFATIYQPGYCPEVQLIYGVKMGRTSKLFCALGPIVNEKTTYESGGAGQYMADFLASRMYADYLNVHQCAILAAYVLYQAKEHVDGCGGNSQIAVLRDDGVSGRVEWKRVEAITELLEGADRSLGELLVQAGNLNLSPDEFKERVAYAKQSMETSREIADEEIKRFDSIAYFGKREPVDELGLPMPSDAQTSEDQR